jgi:uncharacterized protein YjiS (DUF1127 family)
VAAAWRPTNPSRLPRAGPAGAGLALEIGPVNPLKDALVAWAQHREFRAVLAELRGYSDRELAELGLARGDIARVAWVEAERRIATPPAPAAASARPAPALLAAGRYQGC